MMTKEQIEAILERVRTWPRERQEDAANILLRMEEQNAIEYELTEDELADLAEAEKEAENGEFATGEEMKARCRGRLIGSTIELLDKKFVFS